MPYDKKERDRIRIMVKRRLRGVEPRRSWLNRHDLSRLKPWETEGISRSTWYRRRREERQA